MPIEPPIAGTDPNRSFRLLVLLRHPLGALFLLVPTVLVIYSPALDAQFLWDDLFLVRRNQLIRSPLFCLEAFRQTLFDNASNFYRPTQTLTFIANYWVWGMNPFGFHLASILIHAANAVLLCLVLRQVVRALLPPAVDTRRRADWTALVLALLWAVHPVHSAAVAYVSGSADSLAMFCCLSAWLACERALATAHPAARGGWATLAFVGLMLGLCSKEIAGIWLVIFGMYLFAARPGLGTRRARLVVAASGLLAVLFYLALRHLAPLAAVPPPPPKMPAKWLLMLRALGDYGSLLLYPKELFMERQVFAAPGLDNAANEALYLSLALSGVGMLTAFAAGAWWPGGGRGLRRAGAVWFLVGFLPVSNLFALNASVAEHWLYLPSIGFLLFLAGVSVDLPWHRLGLPNRAASAPALALLILLPAAALGARTWFRTFDWMDETAFYTQTVHDAGDVPRAQVGLAMSLSHQHRTGVAVEMMREVSARYPKVLSLRLNLASALLREGRGAEAKPILEKAGAEMIGHDNNPRETVAVVDGLDKVATADPTWPERRRALLASALQRNPNLWELVLISLHEPDGRSIAPEQALAQVGAFADAHWWHAPARFMVGSLEAELGRTAEALVAFRQAARLDVHDDGALAAAAALCVQADRLDEAVALQETAVRRQPDSPQQRFAFAQILARHGDRAQADQELATANELVRFVRR